MRMPAEPSLGSRLQTESVGSQSPRQFENKSLGLRSFTLKGVGGP